MEHSEFELKSSAKADFINEKIKEMMANGLFDEAISIYPIYNRMVNEIICPYDHINGSSDAQVLKKVNIYMSVLHCTPFKSMSDFEKWSEKITFDYVEKLKNSGFSVCEMIISDDSHSTKKIMIKKD